MGKKTLLLVVEGMTCSSCESRIERSLLAIPGAYHVKADQQGGRVVVEYDESRTSPQAAKAAIEKAGYTVKEKRNASTLLALGAGLVLAAIYLIASAAGLFDALPTIDASIGYGMLFIAGLLTSIHCVAMCGGIALSQSLATASPDPSESVPAPVKLKIDAARLSPGLLYNGGRVISYTIIGGLVGSLGSVFSFSSGIKGAIAGAAGLFMLYLGLKMLGIVPALPGLSRLFPAGFGKTIGHARRSAAKRGPFAVGLLNGLMPCGPLQTMQLYALGTGSFFAGALSMFIFSIGTVPLMLTFGIAATLLPRRFLPTMVKASAVLVMFLGIITFSRAASLAGFALPAFGASFAAANPVAGSAPAAEAIPVANTIGSGIVAKPGDGVQAVTTEFKNGNYVPFTVQEGIPVKWIIRVTASDLKGCNNPVTIPSYGIQKLLVAGDNLIEFTPKKTGTITYTCWMGMISSRITVVKKITSGSPAGKL
jgi:sulfite exporter TauE/SafE/copper chaperone CopZ